MATGANDIQFDPELRTFLIFSESSLEFHHCVVNIRLPVYQLFRGQNVYKLFSLKNKLYKTVLIKGICIKHFLIKSIDYPGVLNS